MALSSRGQDSGTAADRVPDAGSAPRTLWDFLFVTAFVPAVAWDRVTDESSLQDDLVRVAREDLSFKQEEIDGTFESAVAAYVPYRSLATTMANRLHNYIDKWSRSEEKPGSKKCLKCLLDDWSTIRDGFMSALSSQSLEPPSKCLVLGLFASDVVYHVLSKLIGDEEHEGREPIWKMLSGALINVVLPVDLLSQAGRRLLRTIKRQAVKDLEQSGWSPVGLRWYDFDMAICEGYGDDDALVESPQPTRVQKAIESATVPIRALKFTEDFIDKAPRALVVPPLATTPSSPQGAIHPTPVRGRPVSNYYLPAAGGGTSVIDQVSAIEEPIREGVVSPGDRHKAITAAKGLPQISPPYKGLSDSRRFSWLKATIRKVLRAAAADVPTHWYYLQRSIDINLFNQIPLPNFDPCDMASFCRATNSVWEYLDTICEGKYALQQLLDEKPQLKQRDDEQVSSFVSRCAQWLDEAKICNHLVYTYEIRMMVTRGLRNTYLSMWSADLGEDLSFPEFCSAIVQKAASLRALGLADDSTKVADPKLLLSTASPDKKPNRQKKRFSGPSWVFDIGSCQRCGERGHFARECPKAEPSKVRERCEKCGALNHGKDDCKFKLKAPCKRCGEEGHSEFICSARSCRQQKDGDAEGTALVMRLSQDQQHQRVLTSSDQLDRCPTPSEIADHISNMSQLPPSCGIPAFFVDLYLYGLQVGFKVRALVDVGADVDIINHSLALRLEGLPLRRPGHDARISLGNGTDALALMYGRTVATTSTSTFEVAYWSIADLPYEYVLGRESVAHLNPGDLVDGGLALCGVSTSSDDCTVAWTSFLRLACPHCQSAGSDQQQASSIVDSCDDIGYDHGDYLNVEVGADTEPIKEAKLAADKEQFLKPPRWASLDEGWNIIETVAYEEEAAIYYVRSHSGKRFYVYDVSPSYVERVSKGSYTREIRSHTKFTQAPAEIRVAAADTLREMVIVGKLEPVIADDKFDTHDGRLPPGLVACSNTYPVGGDSSGRRVRPIFPYLMLNKKTDVKAFKFHQQELAKILTKSRYYAVCTWTDIADAFMSIRCSPRARSCLGLYCPEIETCKGKVSYESPPQALRGWFRFTRTPYGYSPSPWVLEQCAQHALWRGSIEFRLPSTVTYQPTTPANDFSDESVEKMVSSESSPSVSPELLNYMDDCLAMLGLTLVLIPNALRELCSAMVEYVRSILLDADLHLKDPKTITFEHKNFTANGVYYHSPYVIGWPPERLRAVKSVRLSTPVSYREALEFLGILHVVACWLLPPWIILRKNCLQSLLQQRLHEDNAGWDEAIDDDCYPLLEELMSSLQSRQLEQYNVFRRIICWAPLHIYCDASSYAYGYVVGQYYEDISVNLDEQQKKDLSAELASIHGDLAPRQDATGRLFIPLWFRQALFSRAGQLTAHINTKEIFAATSAIVGVISTVGSLHQARLEIYTDNATCLKVLRMWKPAPPGDSVVDAAQSLMQERFLRAVSSCVSEQHLRALRVHFVPGTSNPADKLTRDDFTEKAIMLMPSKKSIRQHQQCQVRQPPTPGFLKLTPSSSQPPNILTTHPGILGRSLVATRLSTLWKLARILRAWHLVVRKDGEGSTRPAESGIRLGFQQWLCEKQEPLQIDPNDNRFLKIGLLWYQVTLFSPAGDLIPQLLLPSSKDDDGILANLVWHLHFSTAHSCPAIVLGLVRNYCVWQKQRRFVQDLLRSCDYCQRVARDRIRDYCGVRQIHTIPWYRVGLDVYGPVYRAARYDKQGRAPYNYVLSYTCYYTNKTILRPLHHCSGSEIAMVHKQVVADFGRMPFLSVDCGSEFMNQDFLSVTVEEGIEVCYDSPNSPWSRAPVERRHSVISKLLRVLALSGRSSEWHQHLDEATMAINSSSLLRGDQLLTPDMLFFSYRPCSALSLWFSPLNDGARSTDLREQLKLRLIYDAQWMQNRETDRLEVDKRGHVPRPRPEVGDEVLVWVDPTGDKFKYSWRGPYTVMDYTDKGQVVLEGLKRPQALSNVKIYHRDIMTANISTTKIGDVPPKEHHRLDGVTQNDFLMAKGSLYQVVSVNYNEATIKAVKVTIEDSVLIYSDEVCEFDMLCTETFLVPGIRVTNGTVSLSRTARRMLNTLSLQ